MIGFGFRVVCEYSSVPNVPSQNPEFLNLTKYCHFFKMRRRKRSVRVGHGVYVGAYGCADHLSISNKDGAFLMTKIMVISDTHDDSVSMDWTLNYLEIEKIDTVIHLGDYYDDASILEEHGHDLIRVPGTWDTCYYPDPNVENRKFIDVEGWKIFLTHTPESHYNDLPCDIEPESVIVERNADIFLYGHTHIAEMGERNGMVLINPGHMYNYEDRGYPMTFSILEIDEEKLSAGIIRQRDNKQYLQEDFDRGLLRMPVGV